MQGLKRLKHPIQVLGKGLGHGEGPKIDKVENFMSMRDYRSPDLKYSLQNVLNTRNDSRIS